MSIEMTHLDTGDNSTAVKNWLDANKDGFFDTVVRDDALSPIICNVTGGGILCINPGNREGHYFQANSGARNNLDLAGGSYRFDTAVKTSKGLALITEINDNRKKKCVIFITKTNNGTVCAAWTKAQDSTCNKASDLPGIYAIDFNESNTIFDTGNQTVGTSTITSIASLPIGDTLNVSDGIYMMASGYNWFNGPVELNGKNYFEYQALFLEE